MRSRRCVNQPDLRSAPSPRCSGYRNEALKTGRAAFPSRRNTSSGSSVFTSSTGRIESVKGVLGVSGLRNNITEKSKKPEIIEISGFFGAVTQIRTGDLILTKDALYRLSYISKCVAAEVIIQDKVAFGKRFFKFLSNFLAKNKI